MASTSDTILLLVEAHLHSAFGPESSRASVSFLGTERIEVLRFGPDADGVVRYATLGMSRYPMADPGADLVAQHGPRAELVLSVRDQHDDVLRRLAILAASPSVEGVVIAPGAGLDLGEALWEGARFTAVLVGEPGGLVPDLELDGDLGADRSGDPGSVFGSGFDAGPSHHPAPEPEEPVRFLPLLAMTPNEAAWKRVHGAAALTERWLAQGLDLRDPRRREADLA